MQISANLTKNLVAEIKEKQWWQGSLISGSDLFKEDGCEQSEWWVIASQTCNLYNSCFQTVPVFEIVAACSIEKCDPGMVRGDNPRILHVEAQSEKVTMPLEINIQRRRWCPRQALSELPAPTFHVRDVDTGPGADGSKTRWLDNFIGWLARSYTRVALPDAFNVAMDKSKLKDVFKKKLAKHKDELYGIYFSLEPDSDKPVGGLLGEMLPPYLLNIVLVTEEEGDPELLKSGLLKTIFSEKIKDPENNSEKLTRAELALRHKIRLIEADIEAMSVAEITLVELRSLVRYSFVDHLSDSSMAAP